MTGDYSHLQEAWKKTEQFIQKNNFEKLNINPIIEIYKIGVEKEKRPSKWITEIYIAVKPKAKLIPVEKVEETTVTTTEVP